MHRRQRPVDRRLSLHTCSSAALLAIPHLPTKYPLPPFPPSTMYCMRNPHKDLLDLTQRPRVIHTLHVNGDLNGERRVRGLLLGRRAWPLHFTPLQLALLQLRRSYLAATSLVDTSQLRRRNLAATSLAATSRLARSYNNHAAASQLRRSYVAATSQLPRGYHARSYLAATSQLRRCYLAANSLVDTSQLRRSNLAATSLAATSRLPRSYHA